MNERKSILGDVPTSHRERLRQQFLAGDSTLAEEQELELLLSFSIARKDVAPLARNLIMTFGCLDGVLRADSNRLLQVPGVGESSVCLIKLTDSIRRHMGQSAAVQQTTGNPTPDQSRLLTAYEQRELFIRNQANNTDGEKSVPVRSRPHKTIQDILLPEGLLAARLSLEAKSLPELQAKLIGQLSQNSIETRRRYAQSVIRWFFTDNVHGLVARTWASYQDGAITNDILRYLYLVKEPVMGLCVSDALFPLEPGISIPPTYFDRFLAEFFNGEAPNKTRERLKQNLKKLGFLERSKGKPDRLANVTSQKISSVLLLHHLFAANSVRTIEVRHLLANPFWKYLGYKSEDAVRSVLREADAAGLFGKYIVADQLEQITTCFTFDEILERNARL
jgi:hypothetical protein